MTGNNNPFAGLAGDSTLPAVTEDGRDMRGRFTAGRKPSPEAKKTLINRKKGEPQTPRMNFAARVNWIVRMLSSVRVGGFIYELRRHESRKDLTDQAHRELWELERRALELQHLADGLYKEVAAWNKKPKFRKMGT